MAIYLAGKKPDYAQKMMDEVGKSFSASSTELVWCRVVPLATVGNICVGIGGCCGGMGTYLNLPRFLHFLSCGTESGVRKDGKHGYRSVFSHK